MIQSLARYAPGTSPTTVLQAGAAELQAVFGEAEVQGVRRAYLVGIHGAWILNLALCGAAVVVGLLAPRISIVGKTGVQSAPDTDSETNPRPASEMDEKEGEEGGSGGGAR